MDNNIFSRISQIALASWGIGSQIFAIIVISQFISLDNCVEMSTRAKQVELEIHE